jgi:hypothetical protein
LTACGVQQRHDVVAREIDPAVPRLSDPALVLGAVAAAVHVSRFIPASSRETFG